MRNWEEIKRTEKGRESVMDGIPGSLPSLLYAHKVQRKAASQGVRSSASAMLTQVSAPNVGLKGMCCQEALVWHRIF